MTPTDRQIRKLNPFIRKTLLIAGVSALTLGTLQPVAAQDDPAPEVNGVPQATVPMPTDTARPYVPSGLSGNDMDMLEQALSAIDSELAKLD